MARVKIGIIVGSNRRDSLNRKLALALSKLGASKLDFTFIAIDDLPMYNQDLEGDMPASVLRFKAELEASDGLLVVTPEHSRSIPAVLKNALDWGARPWGKNSWAGTPVAITGTSPGVIGTAVAQQHLRQILGVLGAVVMGGEAYVQFKPGLIDDAGSLTDESTGVFLQSFIDQFGALVARLSSADRRSAKAA